jgi:hypothetical protein
MWFGTIHPMGFLCEARKTRGDLPHKPLAADESPHTPRTPPLRFQRSCNKPRKAPKEPTGECPGDGREANHRGEGSCSRKKRRCLPGNREDWPTLSAVRQGRVDPPSAKAVTNQRLETGGRNFLPLSKRSLHKRGEFCAPDPGGRSEARDPRNSSIRIRVRAPEAPRRGRNVRPEEAWKGVLRASRN